MFIYKIKKRTDSFLIEKAICPENSLIKKDLDGSRISQLLFS